VVHLDAALGEQLLDVSIRQAVAQVLPDVYNKVTELDAAVGGQLADAMELRAKDPAQQAMLAAYLADLNLPDKAAVVEIGCGTGAISGVLAARAGVGEVTGVDPSPIFLDRARDLSAGAANLSFRQGDGHDLPLPGVVRLAVLHTVLSHVSDPVGVLGEAFRVLRPGGALAVFDGDYNTISVDTGDIDPLQACADAMVQNFVNDRWIIRRLPAMTAAAGYTETRLRIHGYAQTTDPAYLLSIVDRGADALVAAGRIGPELCQALKSEARRRSTAQSFFGYIAYASLTSRKPG
jgi:SAM-dependent methyltransferase